MQLNVAFDVNRCNIKTTYVKNIKCRYRPIINLKKKDPLGSAKDTQILL